MRKLLIVIALVSSAFVTAQVSEDNFEKTFPDVKSLEIDNAEIIMGYKDKYDEKTKLFAYKVNGIYLEYENEKWFIPYRRIRSIDEDHASGLLICLKG